MAKRNGWLEVPRKKKHSCLWWAIIGWWERPIATICLLTVANILKFKGVRYRYY